MIKKHSRLAAAGGPKFVTMPQPKWPVSDEKDVARMAEVVRSGKWSWLGEHERAFCRDFASFIGTRYCAGLSNGTVTLQCALQALGVTPGDEVIVPGMTWVATAQAAMDVGATVVFADIDRETLGFDPSSLEAAVTRRTKAVIPVHLYGCMTDMDAVMAVARRHKLKVVEDVAHQHGSRWRGKGAGAIGDAGSFSFQQSKTLTCGEGGALTMNSPDVYGAVFALKHVGWKPRRLRKSHFDDLVPANFYGHNYRLSEMQAVLLRGGLARLEAQTRTREERAMQITKGLEAIGGPLRAARRDPRVTRQAYYCMTFVYEPDRAAGFGRNGFLYALAREGCGMGITYAPVYRNPLLNLYHATSPVPFRDPKTMQDYKNLRLKNSEMAYEQTTALLFHHHLLGSSAYINQLLGAIRKVSENIPAARAAWEKEERRLAAKKKSR